MLVRSVGPTGLRLPHTGALKYAADAPRIPAAAISSEDADRLQRMADRGEPRRRPPADGGALRAATSSRPTSSARLRGRETPDEVVVVGGHLDSWDVGAGATDDGGGCVVTWEALRIMKKLNLRPRRTVRVVLWTNEENGGRGGLAYRDQHRAELARHVMMIESDNGVFRPLGFGFTGSDTARQTVTAIATLLSGSAAPTDRRRAAAAPTSGPSVQRRPHSRPVARGRRLEVLPDPPHAGRHRRQDRSGRDGEVRGRRCGDGLRRRRSARSGSVRRDKSRLGARGYQLECDRVMTLDRT